MPLPVRVLLIADDPLARAGLAALLADSDSCDVVGLAAAGEELAQAAALFRPDVALWDLGWEPEPDFDLLTQVTDILPPVVVLVDETDLVASLLAAGVRGVLSRRTPAPALENGLLAAAQNLLVLTPELAGALTARLAAAPEPLVEELTAREMDVLQLMAEGAANKSIARELEISENTVKYHVNAILGKLDAQSRTEAVVSATRMGLIWL
ncbi:MAG: response regulator transcription factor [Caldilineaceae bacterium]|nr:response regulator transcription factor [Caldilineaceae bacterium]